MVQAAGRRILLVEAIPQRRPDRAEVGDNRARVVQLVAGGDQQHILILLFRQMSEVLSFALTPRRLRLSRNHDCVGAAHDDIGDSVAEILPDARLRHCPVAGVFNRVVQEGVTALAI